MTRAARILSFSLLALAACGGPRDGTRWRFAIEEAPGSVQDHYAQRFAALVEERTGGAVDVVVYPYGALGTSDQITEQLHAGTIEFAFASPGHIGKLIPELQAFLLHHVLGDDEEASHRALRDDRALHAFLDRLFAEKRMAFLAVVSEGWMAWTTRREVRTPAEMEGLKFRVMTSPLLVAAYDAYGASPTPLPYGEVYGALQLRMIDAQVNPVFAIEEMSFHEVTDWLIFPRQAQFVTTLAANRAFRDRLPPARRAMLEEVVRELADEIFEHQRALNRERLELIRRRRPELRVIELDHAEREAFRRRDRPVRQRYLELAGPRGEEMLRILEEAIERSR